MDRQHLGVHAPDDAPTFEFREFCDSEMKCFGEHHLFQHLAPFLGRSTAFKLYSCGNTLKSIVERSFSGLRLRLAMASFSELWSPANLSATFRPWAAFGGFEFQTRGPHRLSKKNFLTIMHELSQVLQDGLHLHRRCIVCIVTCFPFQIVTNQAVNRKVGILWITAEQSWRGLEGRRQRFGILQVFAPDPGRMRRAVRFS